MGLWRRWFRFSDQEDGGQIKGVAVGLVTDNVDPDGAYRVKVRFPWLSDDEESHWARVTALMAGKDRGTFFLPEVGDEVLLAFDHDDIRHPYVLGGLWNGQDSPPESNADGRNNIRKIRSRSGHEIVFNDDAEEGKEKVEIRTKGGHVLLLDDSAGAEKIEIKDKTGSSSMVIDSAQNSIELESVNLNIQAQTIAIEAAADLILKASGDVTVEGTNVSSTASAQLKVEGSAGAEISSGGSTVVKGSVVQIN